MLKAVDVHRATNKAKLLFILHSSKTHGKHCRPQTITITRIPHSNSERTSSIPTITPMCPYITICEYIRNRLPYVDAVEQFFILNDRSPVTPDHVRRVLKTILSLTNINSKLYCCHCFRAGHAGDLLKMGISVETIKRLGRWKSNIVFTYLR